MDKVTTEKPKNPGRQEWGRKLGKMQKELKQKKHVEEEHKSSSYLKWEYVVAGVTILVGIGALYYQKKSYEGQLKTQQKKVPVVEKKEMQFSDF